VAVAVAVAVTPDSAIGTEEGEGEGLDGEGEESKKDTRGDRGTKHRGDDDWLTPALAFTFLGDLNSDELIEAAAATAAIDMLVVVVVEEEEEEEEEEDEDVDDDDDEDDVDNGGDDEEKEDVGLDGFLGFMQREKVVERLLRVTVWIYDFIRVNIRFIKKSRCR
jgi:hypothetical protein